MLRIGTILVLVGLTACLANRVSYEGYKVYHVTPKTVREANLLHSLSNNPKYDFWLEPRALNVPASVMVTPEEQQNFEKLMEKNHIKTSVLIENVEKTIPKPTKGKTPSLRVGNVTFLDYMTHSDMNAYLNQLAVTYPNIVTLLELGESYEGRPLFAVKISAGGDNHPAIFVDAGIHAREWISPPTALYLIQQLVETPANFELYEHIDWIILPCMNPDGYEYSRNFDALWRKTRSLTTIASCPGTDGNRNFDYYWMEIGASLEPCTEIYAGPQPLSEVETQAVANFLHTHNANVKLYLTLHSYGRYLLYPWGYTYDLPSNDEELYNLGFSVAEAIKAVAGTTYSIGSSSNLLYPAAGGSDDYAMGACGIELSYTIELPEGGTWGFHPPTSRIQPIVAETFEGFKAYHRYIQEKYVT